MSEHVDTSPLTCVLVDDHEAVRQALRRSLERLEWVEVVGDADNGADGVELIRRHAPRVAIVDVRMEPMNGFEVLEAAGEASPDTCVVLCSAFDNVQNRELAERLGAAGYIAKDSGFGAMRVLLEELRAD